MRGLRENGLGRLDATRDGAHIRRMKVSAAEFLERYGPLSDRALVEPITITRDGRDRLVLVSAEEFERLRRTLRRARTIEELSEAEVEAIAEARVSAEHEHLNALLDDAR